MVMSASEGFWRVEFAGGAALVAFDQGRIVGADLARIRYSGRYEIDRTDGSLDYRLTMTAPASGSVTLQGQTLPPGGSFTVQGRMSGVTERQSLTVQTDFGPIQASFERLDLI
jgi:hypothetical protein